MAHPVQCQTRCGTIRGRMLAAMGVTDVDELFEQIPDNHLARTPNGLAPGVRAEASCAATSTG